MSPLLYALTQGDIANMFAEALDAARKQQPEGPMSGDHRWDFQIDSGDSALKEKKKEKEQQQQQHIASLSMQKPTTLQEQLQGPLASLPSPVAPRGSSTLAPSTGTLAAPSATTSTRSSSRLPPIKMPCSSNSNHQQQEEALLRDCGFRDCSPSAEGAAAAPRHQDWPSGNPLVFSGGVASPGTGSRQFMPGALPSPQASPTTHVVPDGATDDASGLQKEKSEIFSFSALGWGSPADLDDTLPLMGTMPQAKWQQQHSVELQASRSGSVKMNRMSSASGDEGEISFAYDIEASSVTLSSPQQQGNHHHVALMNGHLLGVEAAEHQAVSPHRYGLFAEDSDLWASSSLAGSSLTRPQIGNDSSLPPLMDAGGEGPLKQQQQQQQQQQPSRLSAAGDVLAQREANGMSYDMSALMGSLEGGDEEDDEDGEYSDFVDPGESASGPMGRRHQFHSLSLSSDNDF